MYVQRLNETGDPKPLVVNEYSKYSNSVTEDGRTVAYYEVHPETASDIWLVSTDGEGEPRPLLRSPASENDPTISPDGRLLAYSSNESGRGEVYVIPTDGSGRRVKVSREGGDEPQWIRSGRALIFQEGTSLLEVDVQNGGRAFSTPRVAFEGVNVWTISRDGNTVITTESVPAPYRLHLVLNWTSEVERLVSSD